MKIQRLLGLSAILITLTTMGSAAETGTLKMQLVYDGPVAAREAVKVNKDVQFCGQHGLKDETLIVNPENKGIQNAVVYVYKSDVPETPAPEATHVLANMNCRFEPRIVVARAGDTIKVTNPDPVGHNANMNFLRNNAANVMIPGNQEKDVVVEQAEPAPIPVDCNIHPWMRAYLVILDHSFVAVSDENGMIEIDGLPVGEELTFRIFHEGGKIDEVKIDGKTEKWRRSRFEVDVKSGDNDLGVVMVPAEAFKD